MFQSKNESSFMQLILKFSDHTKDHDHNKRSAKDRLFSRSRSTPINVYVLTGIHRKHHYQMVYPVLHIIP